MERWKNVEPKIQHEKLENHLSDIYQKQLVLEAKQNNQQDKKFYIKRNMKTIHTMQKDVKQQEILNKEIQEEQQAKKMSKRGLLPNYLVNRKNQAAAEYKDTLLQVELNKRP